MCETDIGQSRRLYAGDQVSLSCRQCGKCCKAFNDIVLPPYDLFRIARYLERDIHNILDKYCDIEIGDITGIPIAFMKRARPFLRKKKCSIEGAKPSSCRVFPLIRVYSEEGEPFYLLPPDICNPKKRTLSVGGWIGSLSSAESDETGWHWANFIREMTGQFKDGDIAAKRKDCKKEVDNLFVMLVYKMYDISKLFVPQYLENINMFYTLLQTTYHIDLTQR